MVIFAIIFVYALIVVIGFLWSDKKDDKTFKVGEARVELVRLIVEIIFIFIQVSKRINARTRATLAVAAALCSFIFYAS